MISYRFFFKRFYFILFFYCCARGTLWHLQTCFQYIILEFTPSSILFHSPSPIPGIISTGVLFYFHTCAHSICTIFTLPYPFPTSSPSHGATPRQDLFHPPVLWFCKRKKKESQFCLFKITLQGVSLWHFHLYMHHNPNWFVPSIFLLSILIPFLWWFQQV
jgi:hypothetical protein